MPKVKSDVPQELRSFIHLGMHLDWEGKKQAQGECTFCGSGKFFINVENGKWRCWACDARGNPKEFIGRYHKMCLEQTSGYEELREERKILHDETLSAWGVASSVLRPGEWLIPAYNAHGKLHQLYRWCKMSTPEGWKWRAIATPGIHPEGQAHGLFGVHFDTQAEVVYVCEGPWDGMAWYEMLLRTKREVGGRMAETGSELASLMVGSIVVAVPGCHVFQPAWGTLTANKTVVLLYDSDHPKKTRDGREVRPGWDGMEAAVRVMSRPGRCPKDLQMVRWGEEGYDPHLPSGFDLRDALSRAGDSISSRVEGVEFVMRRISATPEEWLQGMEHKNGKLGVSTAHCESWEVVLKEWRRALKLRPSLEDTLACMLAVSCSTSQAGDQLFLQIIGSAGSAKSRFCDAMLTSKNCFALEHLTGFHSGWKDESGHDYSLLARINHKTLITPEGDVVMSSPNFQDIMSQQRRIFDGTSTASYKNRKDDMKYEGLRTPWIMAGTQALLDTSASQARLGDRFLRILIASPTDDDKKSIQRMVGFSALRSVRQTTNGAPLTVMEESFIRAYQVTGGYVDWLRVHAEERINELVMNEDWVVDRCSILAELAADLRSRPGEDDSETHDAKELPTRLTHQLVRLACCLAVVYNQDEVDERVMTVVARVARDTGSGRTSDYAELLYASRGNKMPGLSVDQIVNATGDSPRVVRKFLRFMKRSGMTSFYHPDKVSKLGKILGSSATQLWVLTPRLLNLIKEAKTHAPSQD